LKPSEVLQPLHDVCRGVGQQRTCPLYVDDAKGCHVLIGSGTPVVSGRRAFILTASHVAEELGEAPLILAADRFFLAGPIVALQYPGQPEVDADIALIFLNSATALALAATYQFTSAHEIEASTPVNDFTWYAVAGYPGSKNKPVGRTRDVTISSAYIFARALTQIAPLGAPGKHDSTHLAMPVHPDQYRGLGDSREHLFRLHGMSGGGVWRIDIDATTGSLTGC